MIKKLTEKIQMLKELDEIKKHFRVAKRHRSKQELDQVANELSNLKDKAASNDLLDDNLNISIRCLFESIDYFRIYRLPRSNRNFNI